MIIGIGTDLVEIARIAQSIERLGERFIDRILTTTEKKRWLEIRNVDKANAYVAKRFAAKEAAVKALGTGIGSGVSFQHFSVGNLPSVRSSSMVSIKSSATPSTSSKPNSFKCVSKKPAWRAILMVPVYLEAP